MISFKTESEGGILLTESKPFDDLLDKDTIVISKNNIKISVSYPLKKEFTFNIELPDGDSFTWENLIDSICKLYQHIYKVEAKTSNIKEETIGDRNRRLNNGSNYYLMNRVTTNGRYGIYGHGIKDLMLNHEIDYDSTNDRYTLNISS